MAAPATRVSEESFLFLELKHTKTVQLEKKALAPLSEHVITPCATSKLTTSKELIQTLKH